MLLFCGCERVSVEIPNKIVHEIDSLRFSYWLEDENGVETTVFYRGKPVIMRYSVENLSSDTMYYAKSFSDAYRHNEYFGRVFRTKDNADLDRPYSVGPDNIEICEAIPPYDNISSGANYPEDDSSFGYPLNRRINYLWYGNYYTSFTPKFAYYEQSCEELDNLALEGIRPPISDLMIEISVPSMRIDFIVK